MVTPTKDRDTQKCQDQDTDCPRCPPGSVCRRFHMTTEARTTLDGLRSEQTKNLSVPTTTFRCVCGSALNPGERSISNTALKNLVGKLNQIDFVFISLIRLDSTVRS